jgi:glycine C-acetyltransferase
MKFISQELESIKEKGLYRSLRLIEGKQDAVVRLNGQRVIMLCSNNYLGLANHPRLIAAAKRALEQAGLGSGASRLISGNMEYHEKLEQKIAHFKGTEKALVFNSGYHANLGVIQALAGKEDTVFSDELNHASIIDGCRLSGARIKVYGHKDINHLQILLKEDAGRRKLVITDGVFSMDGDIAPLPRIVEAAQEAGALVMVDEAHATGILGPYGRGTVELFGLGEKVDIQMGTLGKALGVFGAYIAGKRELIDYLINRARSFIFTTAMPPALCAAALAALELVETQSQLRETLWENTRFLKSGLEAMGFDTMGSETPIIPINVGPAERTMEFCRRLLADGIYVQGIRPPTVPEGTCRLRATVMATHTPQQLNHVLKAFRKVGKELQVI